MMWLLLLCTLLWSHGRCQDDMETLVQGLQEKQAALKIDPDLLDQAQSAMSELSKLWTAEFMESLLEEDVSNGTLTPECNDSAVAIIRNHYRQNVSIPEIITLLDATGKQGPGLLEGNLLLFGAFDECFAQNYTGYCMGNVQLSVLPPELESVFKWTVGLCVPKHCTPADVALVMNMVDVLRVDQNTVQCTDTKSPAYNAGAVIMLLVSCVFILLVLIGTIVDRILELLTTSVYRKESVKINNNGGAVTDEKAPLLTEPPATGVRRPICKVKFRDFITAFSLYKTVPTLLATKQAPGVITSLNGMRVISMFWVMLGHVVQFSMQTVDNPVHVEDILPRFSFQVVGNGYYSVDSFFFLSAVLVAYLTFRQMKKTGRFPAVHYYVHRYLRLTPVYAFVLFFTWFLTKHLTTGAGFNFDKITLNLFAQCPKYWWTNLLYINNFYPWKLGDECFMWAWYLAVDMQFYIIAPLILIPLYYFIPIGAIVAGAMLMCSFVITATLAGVYDFQSTPWSVFAYHYVPKTNYTTDDMLYIKPWARISPYIVGLLLGYVLYRGVRLPFGRVKSLPFYLAMWVCSGVLLVAPVYGLYSIWHGHVPSTAENVIYITFCRLSWGLGLALLVFACHNGYGGLINTFLSFKGWAPFARMTFNAYLVHPVVLYVLYTQLDKTFHYTDITIAIFVVALAVFSYAIAAVLCVCVEFPLGSIEMLVFKLVGLGGRESQRRANAVASHEKKVEGGDEEKIFVQGST